MKHFFFLVPPDEVTITGDLSLPVDKTSVYRCEARNANPAPQIQWVVNNDVINVDNNVLTSPTSSSSFSRGSKDASFGDINNSKLNSKRLSSLSSSVQVTTQIHPPPSLSMSLSFGSGAGIQVSILNLHKPGVQLLFSCYSFKRNKIKCVSSTHCHNFR